VWVPERSELGMQREWKTGERRGLSSGASLVSWVCGWIRVAVTEPEATIGFVKGSVNEIGLCSELLAAALAVAYTGLVRDASAFCGAALERR